MSRESWLFLFAGISAFAALVGLCLQAFPLLPALKPSAWAFIGIALSLLLSAWGFYQSLHSVPAFDDSGDLTPINNAEFRNQEVEIDGKAFDGCTFTNVTYVIKGQRFFSFKRCIFSGSRIIKTENLGLDGLVSLQKA